MYGFFSILLWCQKKLKKGENWLHLRSALSWCFIFSRTVQKGCVQCNCLHGSQLDIAYNKAFKYLYDLFHVIIFITFYSTVQHIL